MASVESPDQFTSQRQEWGVSFDQQNSMPAAMVDPSMNSMPAQVRVDHGLSL